MRNITAIFLLSAASIAAQTPDQSISVIATRVLNLPPELTAVELRVAADPTMAISAVVQALSSVGVREEHLVSAQVTGFATSAPQQFGGQRADSVYAFQWSAPVANFRELIGQFEALRRQLPQGITRVENNIFLSASVTAFETARQAVVPEMFAELRTRAEGLAKIAGVNLGGLLSLIDSGTPPITGGSFGLTALPGTRVTVGLSGRFAKQ